jgi:hypothetical protein
MDIKIKMNIRGEKLISVYWFVILFLVAGGIVAMVFIFYGTQYDVREVEATIMINQISDCISREGILNENIFEETYRNNFLENCHLTFETEEIWKDIGQYYFEVQIFEIGNLDNAKIKFGEGNLNLLSSCEIANEDYEKLAKCNEKKFYSVGKNNEQYLIKILSIVRKSEKNVKN